MTGDPFRRLRQTPTFRGGGHQRWQEALVGVAGCGNVGGKFAIETVRSGGRVWICDLDWGCPENIGTQQVDVGKPKAESVADACNSIFPDRSSPRAEFLAEDIRHAGVAALDRCDVLVDASDDPRLVRYLTTVSNGLGKPLLRLALDGGGEREMGRVLVSAGGNGRACALCTHEPTPVDGERTPCERVDRSPTLAGNAMGMAIAAVGLLQAQRLVTGRDTELVWEREVLLDLTSLRLLPQVLERSPDCVSGHERWEVVGLSQGADEVCPDLLFELARGQRGEVRVVLEVHQPHQAPLCFDRRQGEEAGLLAQPLSRLGLPPRGGLALARANGHPPIAYLMS